MAAVVKLAPPPSSSTAARRLLADEIHRLHQAKAAVDPIRQAFERLRDEQARAEGELTAATAAYNAIDARYAEALQQWAANGDGAAPQTAELAKEKAEADRRVATAKAPLTATKAALERATADLSLRNKETTLAQQAIGDATLLVLGEIANELAGDLEQRIRDATAADDMLRGLIEFLRKHSGWLRDNNPNDNAAWRKCNAAWSAVGKLRAEAQARAERTQSNTLADAERAWTDFMVRLSTDAATPAPGTET